MRTPAGGVELPNQVLENAAASAASLEPLVLPSMKITEARAGMLVTPRSGTDTADEFELSSIRQPEMLMAVEALFVTSTQSALNGLLPLDHGATSQMNRFGCVGFPPPASVMLRVKFVLASGLPPTVESSTLTVML